MKIKQVIEGLRDPKDNPCWKGYKPVGTKKKNGKTVPNCVPKEGVEENAGTLKVSKDDDKQTILVNPSTGVQTQIDKTNPNAPHLTQDEQGKLKLQPPAQGAASIGTPNLVGKDVEMTASEQADDIPQPNTKSAITGDEEHDEITKLLVQKLRKLAGVDKMTDETVQDMGNGVRKKTNPDGSYEISDGSGTKVYNAQGQLVKTVSPRFAGVQTSTDAAGKTNTSYQAGPLSVNKNADGSSDAEYDVGAVKLKTSQNAAGQRTNTAQAM